jgi:choice-of-anchor B domain-containing protein
MKIKYYIILFFVAFVSNSFAQLNIEKIGHLAYDRGLNDIWGYAAPDGTEYALVGTVEGTSIVSLADPSDPVEIQFIPGITSTWRDLKTYEDYAYVGTEADEGLLIIDLSTLPDTCAYKYELFVQEPGDTLTSSHNIFIDEFGSLYFAGGNLSKGGVIMYDLTDDPWNPSFIANCTDVYSHDVYVRDKIVYSSEIFEGIFSVYNIVDPQDVKLLGSAETPFLFTHNTWLSDDSKTLFTTDEKGDAPVAAFDVSDFSNIIELDKYIQSATAGQGAIPHNTHVLNDYQVVSHYGLGVIILDSNRPSNNVEVGSYDTTEEANAGGDGVWGAYPFLPSGNLIISDRQQGLFVLRPEYNRASYLEGIVRDASTGSSIFFAQVSVDELELEENTSPVGRFKTGKYIPEAQTVEVVVSKEGYISQALQVELVPGELVELEVDLELDPDNFFATFQIIDTETEDLIEASSMKLSIDNNGELIELDQIDIEGGVLEVMLPTTGFYSVTIGGWGYETILVENFFISESENNHTIRLSASYEDPFALDLGWQSLGIGASGKGYSLGVPELIFSGNSMDVEGDIGEQAYTTSLSGLIDENSGYSIISPDIRFSRFENPVIEFSYLYYNSGEDLLEFILNDDGEEMLVAAIDTEPASEGVQEWRKFSLPVVDFTGTSRMRVKIRHRNGEGNTSEVSIDDFRVIEGETVSTKDKDVDEAYVKIYPNPVLDVLYLEIQETGDDLYVKIVDRLGRTRYTEHKTLDQAKEIYVVNLEAGIYFLEIISANSKQHISKFVKY